MRELILHASAIAYGDCGLLITGASGSGKSTLALSLIALGAELVCDDRCVIVRDADCLVARPAPNLAGMIEARGLGILRADHRSDARICAVVDLDQTEMSRLPVRRDTTLLDVRLPCIHKVDSEAFPFALLQYLKTGFAKI